MTVWNCSNAPEEHTRGAYMEEEPPNEDLRSRKSTRSAMNAIRAFGNVVGSVGNTVVGSVGSTVGKTVVAVKENIGGGEFDRIKTLHQLAREHPIVKSQYISEREWADAESRADEVLAKFYHGYFEAGFDPVKYELERLTPEADPEEIESVVDKLTNGVEVRQY